MTKRRTTRPRRRQRTIGRVRASADAEEVVLARASGRAWYLRPNKKRITLYLDADIVEWFKSEGPGY